VEEAVRLRERLGADRVVDITAVSCGPTKCQETLRTALAMGADRAVHVELPEDKAGMLLEPLAVAKLLTAIVQREKSNLVILGKQAIDDDSAQTGQMLAGLLNWPQATFASKLEVLDTNSIKVTREIDGGLETIEALIPLIVTTDLRLNEPRYASLPNIMKAKKKPLTKLTPSDLGVDTTPRLNILHVTDPPVRKGGIILGSVDELVDKLRKDISL